MLVHQWVHEVILTEFSNFYKNPQWKVSKWDKFLQHEAKAGKDGKDGKAD